MPQTLATMKRRRPPGHVARQGPALAPDGAARKRFDREYWLGHCNGYRVDSVEGRLGFVEEVRGGWSEAGDGDVVLAVRAGRLGRRLLLVPAAEIAFVVPRAKRISLRSPTMIAGTEVA